MPAAPVSGSSMIRRCRAARAPSWCASGSQRCGARASPGTRRCGGPARRATRPTIAAALSAALRAAPGMSLLGAVEGSVLAALLVGVLAALSALPLSLAQPARSALMIALVAAPASLLAFVHLLALRLG